MRKFGWYAVTLLVAVLILGSVLLLAANLYVQSPMVQQRIRHALTTTLRMPVSIRKITVTPWEGLRIDGLTAQPAPAGASTSGKNGGNDAPSPAAAEGQPGAAEFLTADSFRVEFALLPLLRRQFVVTLLWLDKPQLAWAQEPDGRWEFPPGADAVHHRKRTPPQETLTPAPETNTTPPPPPPTIVLTSPAPSPSTPVPTVEPTPRPSPAFAVALDKIRLRHGGLAFLNAKRRPIWQFDEVNLDGHVADMQQRASGAVWFDKAWMPRVGLSLTQFRSNFAYVRGEGLTLNDSTARFAGGTIAAHGRVNPQDPGTPFSAECQIDRVKIAQLLQEIGTRLRFVDGSLQGKIVFRGTSDNRESREATGQFELVDARLKDFPLFQTLGDTLHIADLSHMVFKQARVDCRLDGTMLTVEPLLLVSNDLRITAQGRYRTADDQLDLHARLVIDEAVSRQLPDFIGDQFKPCGDDAPPGSRFVDFNVTGPLDSPKSDLYNRVFGNPMKGFFHDIFSTKPKTPKDKAPKHHEENPPPSPTPPPPAATPGGTAS